MFPGRDLEGPRKPGAVSSDWGVIRRKIDLESVRFHYLRHTATHLVAAGVDIRTVADRHRHSSPAMTLDVDPGRDMDAHRAASATIGRLLDG